MTSIRLDEALVARGLVSSRARARDVVLRGKVSVDGQPARKPSQSITAAMVLTVADEAQRYVSRSALKLLHGLEIFSVSPKDRVCIDLGASIGGFTQVLLEQGATQIIAIDVGHGQMDAKLREVRRVTCIEGLNARDIKPEHVPDETSLLVVDVSFISLKIALPAVLRLMQSGSHLIALIKPQFEVGKANLGKGGIVRDATLHPQVCDDISGFLEVEGWTVKGLSASPLEGSDGNIEFLIYAIKI